jgi:hypothetical protein
VQADTTGPVAAHLRDRSDRRLRLVTCGASLAWTGDKRGASNDRLPRSSHVHPAAKDSPQDRQMTPIEVVTMTGIDIVPIALSWTLMLVLGTATVVGLNGLHGDPPPQDAVQR